MNQLSNNHATVKQVSSRGALLIATCLLAAGCVSQTVRTVDMTPPRQAALVIPEDQLLDVGVAILEANVPESYDEQIKELVQPDIRRAEANYIPFVIKSLLQTTGNWGAVRVVPRATHAVDVTVGGKIIKSDGERLIMEVQVEDARGTQWFDKTYDTLASKYSYEESLPGHFDPFQTIYKQISDDMLAHMEKLTRLEVEIIRATAEMKFAREFAPDAFDTHIEEQDGTFIVKRMPADGDPMLARVRKVREREYLFIDTLDDYYDGFQRKMYPHYQEWRRASYNISIQYQQARAAARSRALAGTAAIVGGIGAAYVSENSTVDAAGYISIVSGALTLSTAINKLNEAAVFSEQLQELGVSAEAEITPHTLELENQTVRLQGTVDAQYADLREILKKTFFEDLGMAVPGTVESTAAPTDPLNDTPTDTPTDALTVDRAPIVRKALADNEDENQTSSRLAPE